MNYPFKGKVKKMSSFTLPQIVFKHICTYIFCKTKDDILKTPFHCMYLLDI